MPLKYGLSYKLHNKAAYSLHPGLDEWMKTHKVGLIYMFTLEFDKIDFVDFYITKEKSENGIDRTLKIVYVNGYQVEVVACSPSSLISNFSEAHTNVIMECYFSMARDYKN